MSQWIISDKNVDSLGALIVPKVGEHVGVKACQPNSIRVATTTAKPTSG